MRSVDTTEAIQDAFERLRNSNIVSDDSEICGCSEDEIGEIEQSCATTSLPRAYKEFLRLMGKRAGDCLRGDDIFYPAMINLTSDLREFIAEEGVQAVIPETAFAFAAHDNYVYLFFDAATGDDPAIHRYVQGNTETEQVYDSFSDWFCASIDLEIQYAEY